MRKHSNSSLIVTLAVGAVGFLAASVFSSLRGGEDTTEPTKEFYDDVPDEGETVDVEQEPDDVEPASTFGNRGEPDDDFVHEDDAEIILNELVRLQEDFSDLEEANEEIVETIGNLTEGLRRLVKNDEIHGKREHEMKRFLKSLSEDLEKVTARVEELSQVVPERPMHISVSPDAIPNAERDAELLNAINDAIQDLHKRDQYLEGALRQITEEMKGTTEETEESLLDVSKAIEETRAQIANIIRNQ